jgi:hypothetical protein
VLRRVENVVRQGRVRSIGTDHIVCDEGTIATDRGQVHVDCTAAGLRLSPGRAIFEPEQITLQQVRTCQPTFNAALVAFVETTDRDDAEKNRLCPPNPYPDAASDWMVATLIGTRAETIWTREPDLAAWMEQSRLNAARGIGDHLGDPRMQSAIHRFLSNTDPAVANLEKLIAPAAPARPRE